MRGCGSLISAFHQLIWLNQFTFRPQGCSSGRTFNILGSAVRLHDYMFCRLSSHSERQVEERASETLLPVFFSLSVPMSSESQWMSQFWYRKGIRSKKFISGSDSTHPDSVISVRLLFIDRLFVFRTHANLGVEEIIGAKRRSGMKS